MVRGPFKLDGSCGRRAGPDVPSSPRSFFWHLLVFPPIVCVEFSSVPLFLTGNRKIAAFPFYGRTDSERLSRLIAPPLQFLSPLRSCARSSSTPSFPPFFPPFVVETTSTPVSDACLKDFLCCCRKRGSRSFFISESIRPDELLLMTRFKNRATL